MRDRDLMRAIEAEEKLEELVSWLTWWADNLDKAYDENTGRRCIISKQQSRTIRRKLEEVA